MICFEIGPCPLHLSPYTPNNYGRANGAPKRLSSDRTGDIGGWGVRATKTERRGPVGDGDAGTASLTSES